MLLTMTFDNKEIISVSGFMELKSYIKALPQLPEYGEFMHHCAVYGNDIIRKCVAKRYKLKKETILLLSQDTSLDVRRAIAKHCYFPFKSDELYDKEVIKNLLVGNDPKILQQIVPAIYSYDDEFKEFLYKVLLESNYPYVLCWIASIQYTPINILEMLANHEDASIRNSAKKSLIRKIEEPSKINHNLQ